MNTRLNLPPDSSPSDLIKLKLTIAYDGTHYKGWQVQPTGITVQQRVEEALRKLFPSVTRIHGSSRTDTGVHALGMVAHVEFPKREFRMPIRKVALAVNAFLPEDIRIVSALRAAPSFHARFDSCGKQYRYQMWNHPAANPILRGLTWHVPVKLCLPLMREAAAHFLGTQDFRSLAANRDYEIEDTTRTIFRCEVQSSGPLKTIVIEGDGFLYKMCRAIAGTLCRVGHGKMPPSDVPRMLHLQAREFAGMTAPAHGLTLCKVYYSPPRRARAESKKPKR